MLKSTIVPALLVLCCASPAMAQHIPGGPVGPYPEDGTFCAPFKLCAPEVVTRMDR